LLLNPSEPDVTGFEGLITKVRSNLTHEYSCASLLMLLCREYHGQLCATCSVKCNMEVESLMTTTNDCLIPMLKSGSMRTSSLTTSSSTKVSQKNYNSLHSLHLCYSLHRQAFFLCFKSRLYTDSPEVRSMMYVDSCQSATIDEMFARLNISLESD